MERLRERMVDEQVAGRGIRDPRVLAAMKKVPRHLFVDPSLTERAYEDHALPIGEGQTISQPYMVGLMSEALSLRETDRVLEVGTGSGYQTAILCELAARVYSIERIPALASAAWALLERLGYQNVVVTVGDGTVGLKDHPPFDGILVAAASPEIPRVLFDQLVDGGEGREGGRREGGRMVVPVGDRSNQHLIKVVRRGDGMEKSDLTPCVFVPLLGVFGFQRQEEYNGG